MNTGAQRVVDRSPHALARCTLKVSPFVVEPMVQISGINETVSEDFLQLFFESEKRSGGGEIKEIDVYVALQMAIITFEKEEGKHVFFSFNQFL